MLFSDAGIASAMDDMAALGINAVLPVVWNGSGADGTHTLYPSQVMDTTFGRPIHPRFSGRDMLRRVVIEAHRNGIEVLPWFEMGFSPSFSQDGGYMLAQKPDWAALDVSGNPVVENGFDWMSATHPDVQAFIHDLTLEVAQNYDVDGVEYSDRIPAMPVRAGYDAATVALYKSEHGGVGPPTNHKDAAWMRWRADRLNGFFRDVRESVKAEGVHLTVAASPSLYPWAYQNYLQDSKTWIGEGIADHVIPQVYRRTLGEYTFELDKSLRNYPGMEGRYFSGMLVRLGSYLIADDYMRGAIAVNRSRGVSGEVFFFYEGLRAEGGRIADVLRPIYAEPALVPGRTGVWRPRATMSADQDAATVGDWTATSDGFQNGGTRRSTSADASLTYTFDVSQSAWYGVYAHGSPNADATSAARYTVVGRDGDEVVARDQTDEEFAGWHLVSTVYLEAGQRDALRLDRATAGAQPLLADDAMLLIDRKRSPDVVFVANADPVIAHTRPAQSLRVYPNPFAGTTTLRFDAPIEPGATLAVFDVLGRHILTQDLGSKSRDVQIDLSGFPAGFYLARATSGTQTATARLISTR